MKFCDLKTKVYSLYLKLYEYIQVNSRYICNSEYDRYNRYKYRCRKQIIQQMNVYKKSPLLCIRGPKLHYWLYYKITVNSRLV